MIKKSLLVALSIVVATTMSSCKEQQQRVDEASTFELQTITTSSFATSTTYSASVQGQQDIDIYPQVSGYLSKIAVTEGQVVKKGDLLFVIEQAPYQAAYNAAAAGVEVAKAAVATAELNESNSKQLFDKGIVSQAEYQTVQNALQSAKASLAASQAQELSAKSNLDFTMIKSPSNGVVGKLPYRTGALVSASSPQSLTTVSDNSTMYVYFSMNENQVYNLFDKYGSLEAAVEMMPELDLRLMNGSVYPLKGKLESISGMIDSSTGSVSLRASFANPERRLLSGSTASVIIPETLESSIVIPKAATFELQGKYFVYSVVDSKAKSTPIEIAKSMSATEYVVTSGLSQGDVIIASGAGLVREGAAVKE